MCVSVYVCVCSRVCLRASEDGHPIINPDTKVLYYDGMFINIVVIIINIESPSQISANSCPIANSQAHTVLSTTDFLIVLTIVSCQYLVQNSCLRSLRGDT